MVGFQCARATPNDPKLSDRRGWRDRCVAGGKAAAEAAGVTAAPGRCSAWLGVRSFRILCIGGLSDCLGKHLVGDEHGTNEQQRKNHRPRKLGGGESDVEESWQYHRGEPKNGVPLQ